MHNLPEMTIRPAVASDAKALEAVEKELFAYADYPLSRRGFYYHIRRNLLLVAETDDGTIAGYILALVRRQTPKLYSLGVLPAYRRHGMAIQLMERLIDELRTLGSRQIVLEVRCDNLQAIALYRSFGFRMLKMLPSFYRDGCDACLMEADYATEKLPETL